MTLIETPFERKIRERREAQAKRQPVAGTTPKSSSSGYSADAPSADEIGLTLSPEQEELDNAIKKLGIVVAYNKWAGKGSVRSGSSSQKEGIKVRCPNPQHPDNNPSAWINIEKNVFNCAACEYGGDIWDIAAWHFGFPVPGYKHDPTQFRQLREKIGTELGFHTVQGINGPIVVTPSATRAGAAVGPAGSQSNSGSAAPTAVPAAAVAVPVVGLTPAAAAEEGTAEERAENQRLAPTIKWRDFIQPASFLWEYLEACCVDTSPEEYHFWNGMLALGMGIGRDVYLKDTKNVFGNLFICLTGPSSAGKSRSKAHLDELLRGTLPYDYNNSLSRGTRIIGQPGSAEYLIYEFQASDEDPSNPKNKIYWPVRGLVDWDELSTLMSVSSRLGNNIRPQLMQLYDAPRALESGSLSGGRRKAEAPFGSVISTTQNRSLRKLLEAGDDGSGFINRWVFAQGKLKERQHIGGATIDLTVAAQKLVQIHQWCFTSKPLELSTYADKIWYDFFHGTVVPAQALAEKQDTAVIARMDLMMKKLFVLFAANRLEDVVSEASVNQAIQLWPYLLKTFGVVLKEIKKTASSDLQEEVIRQIDRLKAANGRGPSRKQIYDTVKRKLSNTEELERLLKTLVKMELIHEIATVPGTVGRPTVRYEVSA